MKVGLLLSGCGMYDGSEPAEAILAMAALDRAGVHALCVAPDTDQFHSVDHLTGREAEGDRRSALMEAARLARGKVAPLGEFWGGDLQGLVIPGGYGAPKTLMSGFMQLEAPRTLLPEVRALMETLHAGRKPIGSISLGRSIVRAYFGEEMTDEDLSVPASEVIVDEERRILFTPGFLTATRISEAARGIDAMIEALLRMAARGLQVVN